MNGLTQKDKRIIGLLLSPSWLSALIAIIAGLVISIGVIAAFTANNSTIQRQLVSWQQNQPAEEIKPFAPDPAANKPTLKNSWPLLIVWSVIGLVVYTIAGAIIHSISKAEEMHESLGYVNADRDKMIRMTAQQLLLRVLAAIGLGVLVSLFIKTVIPYSITAAHASASDFFSVTGVLYLILSFAIVVVCLHLQTIFLRLSLGRVRLFSDVI
jgi:ABC-type antimicrobial peptide transport system permease subunit